jgi:PKHD-type hydroxylase
MNDSLNLVSVENFLSAEECALLIKHLDRDYVAGKTEDNSSQVRIVEISTTTIPNELLERIVKAVSKINLKYYNFNITGFHPCDPVLMFKYASTSNAHYGWHNDFVYDEGSTRKLSFSIQLSDPQTYRGGSLQFIPNITHSCVDQGSIIVFPSYLAHCVTPVTEGSRYCIVGWAHGPAFR